MSDPRSQAPIFLELMDVVECPCLYSCLFSVDLNVTYLGLGRNLYPFIYSFLKDSLAYKGAILWKTTSLNEYGVSNRNQNEMYHRLKTKAYFTDFTFNVVSP